MKIISIIGARPQFIKCAPLSEELRKKHTEVLIHTGQHYDREMSSLFFDELGIHKPDYNLNVGSGKHGWQTGRMLEKIEQILLESSPDLVLVYGDTNSTIAGALASVKLHIPVAHVEAGLRSYDRIMPEEINRILTDHCSDYLFCPTKTAVDNLAEESITNNVFMTGDVMVDAIHKNLVIAQEKSSILKRMELSPKEYYLVTLHRAENTDNKENLQNIVNALIKLDNVIFPSHPRTEKMLRQFGLWDRLTEKIQIIKPVGYLDMLMLESNAKKILTDSGGVQKEAYILKVPCITIRTTTEWIETVQDGWNILTGSDTEEIILAARTFEPQKKQTQFLGEGNASQNIAALIDKLDKNLAEISSPT